jgi:signal transduction histidine kinase
MRRPLFARLLVAAAVASCLGSTATGEQAASETSTLKTVLAIHWGPADYPVTPVVNDAIRESLSTYEGRVDYFVEYLESDRVPAGDASQALADYIRRKYRDRRIDLVLAVADPALRFVLDRRAELFPGVPIIYSGVAVPDDDVRSADAGLTGVMRGVAYGETLKLALDLQPSTEKVFVIARSRDPSTTESVETELRGLSKNVPLTYMDQTTLPDLLAAVKALPKRSVILYVWYAVDEPGFVPDALAVVRQVAEASPIPVYGTNERYVGAGVVGGVVRGSRETGRRMGDMARRILDGARAQDIPVENAQLVAMIDWRQLTRWGIDPVRLPPGANIQFRIPTAWESYRWYISAAIVVGAAQLMLIAGLFVQRARRRGAEQMVLAREATIRASYERIRHLAHQLITSEDAVRADIARDLHDDVCQGLASVSIAVATLKQAPGIIQNAQTQRSLSKIQDATTTTLEGLRRLSHELHPATLSMMGLAAALRSHCVEVEKRNGLTVEFSAKGDFSDLQRDVAVSFFRIAQESLRNAIEHGAARRIAVSLVRAGEQVELTVTDDGRGFDLETVRRKGNGLGLVSIEERAFGVGGDVQILTAVDKGTTIRVRGPAHTGASVPYAPR